MYSQINYLGCFLPIPENILVVWDTLITDFVKGKLNIAKKRLYKTPEDGGLGLFDIRDFLDEQKCAWLKRSVNLNEPWKVRLYIGGFGNLFNTKSQNICRIEFPISYDLCKSFERVSNALTTSNENYRRCYIFENAKITLHLESRATLSKSMFTADFFEQHAARLYRLRYNDFYDDEDNLIPVDIINLNTGLNLSLLHIFRFRGACAVAKTKFKKKR